MTGIYNAELLDKFVISRGYSLKSLRLISIIYRRKLNIENFKNIQIFINHQEKTLVFRVDDFLESHNLDIICITIVQYDKEALLLMTKSLPDARYVQCFLLKFQHYSEVTHIDALIADKSKRMDNLPFYSSTYFERQVEIQSPLNSIMRNFEIDEAKVIMVTNTIQNLSENQNGSKNLEKENKLDEQANDNNSTCKPHDFYSLSSNLVNMTKVKRDTCYYQHLTKRNRVFLLISTDISIQFLDTKFKKICSEIFYVDLKEIIKREDQLNKVIIVVKIYLNTFEYSLESIYLKFADKTICKKFVETLWTKREIQFRSFRLCSNCPINILNKLSSKINDETNEFSFEQPKNLSYSIHRVNNLFNSYLEKIENENLNVKEEKFYEDNFPDRIIDVFEEILKHFESQQSIHNCKIQDKGNLSQTMTSKIWGNVKNLFNKKFSNDNTDANSVEAFNSTIKKQDAKEFTNASPINDDNGFSLKNISSRSRRAISFNESVLFKNPVSSMTSHYLKLDLISNFVHENQRETLQTFSFPNEKRPKKMRFKSIALFIIASQKLMKNTLNEWNYFTKLEDNENDNCSFPLSEIMTHFGPNEMFSYSYITILNKSFKTINEEWDAIFTGKNVKLFHLKKIVMDGVGVEHRKNAWKLLIKTSPHLTYEKITKYDVNQEFQNMLEQMVTENVFGSKLVKDFYKNSFMKIQRCNNDILNDVGRTMPHISYFGIQKTGQLALFNVLRAYAFLDPEVSYCQGMNFIVAIFLIHMNEEEAFATLIYYMIFLERRDIYLPSMVGIKQSFYKLERLITDFCPALNYHLSDKNFPISLYASSWFMTLFVTSYPLHFSIKVFDMILGEGQSVIYNIAITLISYVSDKILQLMEFDIIYEHFCKHLNNLSDSDLNQILLKAAELNINRNLQIYELEITFNKKEDTNNLSIQKLCMENTDLRMENLIFRKKIEAMQKEIMELKRILANY